MNKTKILVGMSGGIDSSAVCSMLLEEGYEVIGLTLRTFDIPSQFADATQTDPNHILEARALAHRLGIEHHVLDVRNEFRQIVVDNFVNEYLCGRTPNPCVLCNLHFKWKYLMSEADRLGCEKVATGHYAQIVSLDNSLVIQQGIDNTKDQSYFLWRLGAKELQRTIFPLGKMTKAAVKEYMTQRGFIEKVKKKESMEVCFIENDYRTFLQNNVPNLAQRIHQGIFIDRQGKSLGKHRGFPYYTIGQRKGLDIALGYPAFVLQIDANTNAITLGTKEELLTTQMAVEQVNTALPHILYGESISVRIRYRSTPIACIVESIENNKAIVHFSEPASAITPGQSAVFYYQQRVIGGALIAQ